MTDDVHDPKAPPTLTIRRHGGAAPAVDAALLPGVAVESFRITGVLGAGAMGVVHAALHPAIGKRAAIKVLRGEVRFAVKLPPSPP